MLRVTVEIVPFGNEVFKKTIGVAHIANDGMGTASIGSYKVDIMTEAGHTRYVAPYVPRIQSIFRFLSDVLNARPMKKKENE
jgi:hypothetical protein